MTKFFSIKLESKNISYNILTRNFTSWRKSPFSIADSACVYRSLSRSHGQFLRMHLKRVSNSGFIQLVLIFFNHNQVSKKWINVAANTLEIGVLYNHHFLFLLKICPYWIDFNSEKNSRDIFRWPIIFSWDSITFNFLLQRINERRLNIYVLSKDFHVGYIISHICFLVLLTRRVTYSIFIYCWWYDTNLEYIC